MAIVETEAVLTKMKRKLSLAITDELQDQLLLDLIEDTMDHFRLISESISKVYKTDIDKKFEFIIKEVAEKRYNRISSEGMTTETVDGHAVSYETQKRDFDPYMAALENSLGSTAGSRGRVYYV